MKFNLKLFKLIPNKENHNLTHMIRPALNEIDFITKYDYIYSDSVIVDASL